MDRLVQNVKRTAAMQESEKLSNTKGTENSL